MNAIDTQFPVDSDVLTTLRRRLVQSAEREGLIDVAYRTVDTPVGVLLLAATTVGLVRIAYEREDFDVILEKIAARAALSAITAPTLVLASAEDRLVSGADVQALVDGIAGARLRTYPGGHLLNVETPQRFHADIRDCVRGG